MNEKGEKKYVVPVVSLLPGSSLLFVPSRPHWPHCSLPVALRFHPASSCLQRWNGVLLWCWWQQFTIVVVWSLSWTQLT
jgi:hypothetical protein